MTKRAKAPRKSKTSRKSASAKRRRAKTMRTRSVRAKATRSRSARAAGRATSTGGRARWKGAVKANLEVTLRLAASFADFPLPDDAEPAPVFTA